MNYIKINGKKVKVKSPESTEVDIRTNVLKWSIIDSLVQPSITKKGIIMFPPIHFMYLVDLEIQRLRNLKNASKHNDEKEAIQLEITDLIREYHRQKMIINSKKKEIKSYGFKINIK